jgi:hypothetical protein
MTTSYSRRSPMKSRFRKMFSRKLALSSETLKTLSGVALDTVVGGDGPQDSAQECSATCTVGCTVRFCA